MLKVCSLSSGSKGNAFFIKTGSDAFLIDAGISCKQICLRLEAIGHSYEEIKGIFITHEHSDHMRGLTVFLKKHPVPVFLSPKTDFHSTVSIPSPLIRHISNGSSVHLNGITVEVLNKSHDAADPSLFNVLYKGIRTGFITDAGYGCENVIRSIEEANILFLESNYDEEMLRTGIYPYFLQQRILSNNGHLSNHMSAELVKRHATAKLSHLFLSHISENNNTPDLALETLKKITAERSDLRFETHLTSAGEVSAVVEVSEADVDDVVNL